MLPKITYPTHEFVVPSTKKKELFRPFLVKEEKLLLMSKTTEDPTEIFRAIKQVINNCAISDSFDIDKLAIFDMEYLFLQLRSVSVNNVSKVSYRDNEDGQIYDFDIDLSQIEVKFPDGISNVIKVNDEVGLKMKYPIASIFNDKQFFNTGDDQYFELILRSVDKVFNGDDVFNASDYSKEELEEFMDQLDPKVYEKILEFMNNMPKLKHTISYTNKNGNTRVIEMNSLNDFFTLV